MNRIRTLITVGAVLLGASACTPQQIADAIASQAQPTETTVEAPATTAAPATPWVHEGEELASATGTVNIIMRVGQDDDGWRVRCQGYGGTADMVPESVAVVSSSSGQKIPVCLGAAANA